LEGEIYHLLIGAGHTNEKIKNTISWAESAIPLIGVLTSLPSEDHRFFTNSKLTSEIVEIIVERTEELVVGAYDGEGYLIWHRVTNASKN